MFHTPTAEHLDADNSDEDLEFDDLIAEPVEEAEETVAPTDGGVVYTGHDENGQLIAEWS